MPKRKSFKQQLAAMSDIQIKYMYKITLEPLAGRLQTTKVIQRTEEARNAVRDEFKRRNLKFEESEKQDGC